MVASDYLYGDTPYLPSHDRFTEKAGLMHHRTTRYALSTAIVVGGTVIAAALAPVAAAEQGQSSTLQSEGGTELTVAVDDTDTVGAGNQAPGGVPFSHSVQVAGRYSVDVHPDKITSGTVAVGYILGCGVDLSSGITVGLIPNQSGTVGITPSVTLGAPPSVTIAPTLSGTAGMSETLSATLIPGQITTVTTATATLDPTTTFPYHLSHQRTPLNVARCASPVTAVPFTTASITTPNAYLQNTAYGNQFTF